MSHMECYVNQMEVKQRKLSHCSRLCLLPFGIDNRTPFFHALLGDRCTPAARKEKEEKKVKKRPEGPASHIPFCQLKILGNKESRRTP